jgi:hypothetical protein
MHYLLFTPAPHPFVSLGFLSTLHCEVGHD